MGSIENIDDYREEKKESNKTIDYISIGVAMVGAYTAFKICKKDLKTKCEWYNIAPIGVGLISYAISSRLYSTLYRDTKIICEGVVNTINKVKEGEDHGRSETGGYQTEQSQEQGDDLLK